MSGGGDLDSPRAKLSAYFEEVFLKQPWQGFDLPSLVCATGKDGVVGFLGVLPRKMRWQDRTILVAVSTHFMVRPDHRGFAGVELMRRMLSGTQDLSLTDTANDISRSMWECLGGQTALAYSLFWTRPLRPAAYFLQKMNGRVDSKLLRLCSPGARFADWTVSSLSRIPSDDDHSCLRPMDSEQLMQGQEMVARSAQLVPDYDPEQMAWLVKMLAKKTDPCALAGCHSSEYHFGRGCLF